MLGAFELALSIPAICAEAFGNVLILEEWRF
jgi:hypothetical protein